MFLPNELLLRARLDDHNREAEGYVRARFARTILRSREASPVAAAVQAPASQRLLALLAELYGPSRVPDQDPALFARLAWTGAGTN